LNYLQPTKDGFFVPGSCALASLFTRFRVLNYLQPTKDGFFVPGSCALVRARSAGSSAGLPPSAASTGNLFTGLPFPAIIPIRKYTTYSSTVAADGQTLEDPLLHRLQDGHKLVQNSNWYGPKGNRRRSSVYLCFMEKGFLHRLK
jgi:hypothetical protein